MGFGHEKLDVYRAAIEYVGWAHAFCEGLKGHGNAKDQLLRASQANPLKSSERRVFRREAIPIPIATPTPMRDATKDSPTGKCSGLRTSAGELDR